VAAPSKASVGVRPLAGIAGSSTAGGIAFGVLYLLCFSNSGLRLDDKSSREVVPREECLSVIVKPQ
jgi:hypothetical protein